MLCNYCLEKISEGEEVRELAAGEYEKGGCYHKECYRKIIVERNLRKQEKEAEEEEKIENEEEINKKDLEKKKARTNLVITGIVLLIISFFSFLISVVLGIFLLMIALVCLLTHPK